MLKKSRTSFTLPSLVTASTLTRVFLLWRTRKIKSPAWSLPRSLGWGKLCWLLVVTDFEIGSSIASPWDSSSFINFLFYTSKTICRLGTGVNKSVCTHWKGFFQGPNQQTCKALSYRNLATLSDPGYLLSSSFETLLLFFFDFGFNSAFLLKRRVLVFNPHVLHIYIHI